MLLPMLLFGCQSRDEPAQIAATTLPVFEFTARLCEGTPLTVTRLVTEQVSCLHDYSLNVDQVKAAESAEVVVISGAGLEDFLGDILDSADTIDASGGVKLLCSEEEHEAHDHESHHHEEDPHIWLSPKNAETMAKNICGGLAQQYPAYRETFDDNLGGLLADLEELRNYGESSLSQLRCRELVTFHDGFSYFAQAFDLTILEAVEEESGSEASAKELKHLIGVVQAHSLPAIFTERNGSVSAADVISRETGAQVFSLDMAMAGDSYFDAMYHNIDTIKEALG
ncbi:MAG: metal ABC transporter substrate-binding protein [Firmicutes bacterium]|nr:metal ABC transporter substrate-binding protein [Bacillota bacterium]